jgi:hypothetical protein
MRMGRAAVGKILPPQNDKLRITRASFPGWAGARSSGWKTLGTENITYGLNTD